MEFLKCPSCGKDASRNTIEKVGLCNNCRASKQMEKYKADSSYRISKLSNHAYENFIVELIEFIDRSDYCGSQKYRIVTDFIKILNKISCGKSKVSEKWLNEMYQETSAIKSPGILEIIKVFLFTKEKIIFDDFDQYLYSQDIRSVARFKNDILDYYFSTCRCHDCGITINSSQQYFCNKCIDYRSLCNKTNRNYIEKKFMNNSVKELFICYIAYLYSLGREPRTVCDILDDSYELFKYMEIFMPPSLRFEKTVGIKDKTKFNVIDNNPLYHFKFSDKWLNQFLIEFKTNKRVKIFLYFLEKMGLISSIEANSKEQIVNKIKTLNVNYQKPLLLYLESLECEIKNLKNKNATKQKKWITIKNTIYDHVNFCNYIQKEFNIDNWAEITEKEINIFLLNLPEKSRNVRKRCLYNFMEFALSKRLIFSNPMGHFISRDFKIETKPLSRNEHAMVYKSILLNKNENPIEAFTTSLVYFHAMTTKQILSIELSHINPIQKKVNIEGRPPLCLSNLELFLLNEFINIRQKRLKNRINKFLYCSYNSFEEKSVNSKVINKHVKKITNLTAKNLRIASLQYCCENFGVEYLHQCLGLSLTQSYRYGDIEDHLIEEIIKDGVSRSY